MWLNRYLALRYPEALSRPALLLPSVWWNKNSILQFVEQCTPLGMERARIWFELVGRRVKTQLTRRMGGPLPWRNR
jgi:predicted alpha/beta superfamily hydrolase